jgi:hypothetical protein
VIPKAMLNPKEDSIIRQLLSAHLGRKSRVRR